MEEWLQYSLLVWLFLTAWKVEEIHRQLRLIAKAAQVNAKAAQVIEQRVEDKDLTRNLRNLGKRKSLGAIRGGVSDGTTRRWHLSPW